MAIFNSYVSLPEGNNNLLPSELPGLFPAQHDGTHQQILLFVIGFFHRGGATGFLQLTPQQRQIF